MACGNISSSHKYTYVDVGIQCIPCATLLAKLILINFKRIHTYMVIMAHWISNPVPKVLIDINPLNSFPCIPLK